MQRPFYLRHFTSLFFILILVSGSFAQEPLPKLSARVTDLTGTLSQSEVNGLEGKLQAFEKEKGSFATMHAGALQWECCAQQRADQRAPSAADSL